MRNFLSKTKGNYHPNSKQQELKKLVFYIAFTFVVLFLSKGLLGQVGAFMIRPVYAVHQYFTTSSDTIPYFFRSRMELENQMQTLQEEISTQQGYEQTVAHLSAENDELRSLLSATGTQGVAAGVILRPPYSPYDTLVIDAGNEAGIMPYATVYYGADLAIGYVQKVYEGYSLVTLFSSPRIETTVYVFGPNIFTTAYGEGGGVIRLSIPQGITIERGDTVVLPSIQGGMLGTVSDIQSIPTEPEQHAYVTFNAPIQSMRLVRVGDVLPTRISFDEALERVDTLEKELFTFDVPFDYQIDSASSTTEEDVEETATSS